MMRQTAEIDRVPSRPALEVISKLDAKGDAAAPRYYCDPPYVQATRQAASHSCRAYRHEMTDDDHRELAALLRSVKGTVVLSGYPSELYDELYGDWRRVDGYGPSRARNVELNAYG